MEQGVFDPNETRFVRVAEVDPASPEAMQNGEGESSVMESNGDNGMVNALLFNLNDRVDMDDLKKIKNILEKYPGDRPVMLNLVVEGERKEINTGLAVEDILSLRQEMGPYVK